MSVALQKIVINSETRVRLIFSGALGSGAFSAALYSVSDITLGAAGPSIVAALAVSGLTNQVELVLASPLSSGDVAEVSFFNVPAADLSTNSGNASAYYGPSVTFTRDVEPEQNASDALVFGRDLVHDGADYVEDGTGDLIEVEGVPNAQGAIWRRVISYDLPWDQSYGTKLDDYVDGPNAAAAPAAGLIKRQVLADDRANACSVQLLEDDTVAGGAFFKITPTLKTDRKIGSFNVAVANILGSSDDA